MKEQKLRDIEKKTYMSYHQDGLLDIFIGTYIIIIGLSIFTLTILEYTTWFLMPAIFPAIMIPIWMSAKKKITMPRIGYVNIGNKGSNKLMSLFLGLLGVGLGMFMALSFGSNIPWMVSIRDLIINNSLIVISVGALVLSSLFAYTTGLNRLYTYGFFSFVVFILGYFVSIPFAYFPLTIGLVFMISGIFLLRQFINKYPLTKGAIANEK